MITPCFRSGSWRLVFFFLFVGSKLFRNVSTTAFYGMEVEKGGVTALEVDVTRVTAHVQPRAPSPRRRPTQRRSRGRPGLRHTRATTSTRPEWQKCGEGSWGCGVMKKERTEMARRYYFIYGIIYYGTISMLSGTHSCNCNIA